MGIHGGLSSVAFFPSGIHCVAGGHGAVRPEDLPSAAGQRSHGVRAANRLGAADDPAGICPGRPHAVAEAGEPADRTECRNFKLMLNTTL